MTGLAILLICTGVFFGIGRLTRDILRAFDIGTTKLPAANDIVIFYSITQPLLVIAALIFTIFACLKRCQNGTHAIITASVTICVMAFLVYGPILSSDLFFFTRMLPVILLGLGTGKSIAYYIGAVLQIVLGVWLLGWFSKRKSQEETKLA